MFFRISGSTSQKIIFFIVFSSLKGYWLVNNMVYDAAQEKSWGVLEIKVVKIQEAVKWSAN